MVFRVFYGEPVPEARELEAGQLAHGEPMNPMTGEPEDTDVGFPGPEHHIAEHAAPMKAAMGPLALLSIVGGVVAIPGVSDILEKFLEPTFHDSRFHDSAPTTGAEVWGLVAGGAISILGIGLAWWVYVRRPGTATRVRERFAWLHRFLVNKWYFDELYEGLFVRPVATIGGSAGRVIETNFVQGTIVGGATGIVRVGTTFARDHPDRLPADVRAVPSARRGRPDPLLPDHELVTIHLSIVLFLPLASGLVAALLPGRLTRSAVLAGPLGVLAYVIVMLVDFESGGGLQWVTSDRWITELGIRYELAVDGAEPVHDRPDRDRLGAVHAGGRVQRCATGRGSSSSTSRSRRPPCSAPSWRRIWRCSSSSST